MMQETYIVPSPTSMKVKKTIWKILQILYIAIILLLMYLPVIFIIILSFNENPLGTEWTKFTFDYYLKMFESLMFLNAQIYSALNLSCF